MKLIKAHSDNRREIHTVDGLLKNKEFSFINLKEHKAIGGCYHTVDEYYVVISGSVLVLTGNEMKIAHIGDSGVFPAGVAHSFVALSDCIISEWGVNSKEKVSNVKNKEMRALIDFINE